MVGRYDIPNNKIRLTNGKIVYKSILFPKIEESEDDIYIISKAGDRLDLLAKKYYNDVTKWWIIAHANKIKGTLIVTPGKQIRIPMNISKINRNLLELNT